MAEEIELIEVQDTPAEEGAGIDADKAQEVVIDLSLLSSKKEKLAYTCGPNSSPSFTICRVPSNIRKCNRAAYNPRIVSIGPFHRGRKNLRAMEEHKWRCLHEVLTFGKAGNNSEKFLREMKARETKARKYYNENIQMSSDEFAKMTMLDGCFIIFLILHQKDSVKFDDLIYGNKWMSRLIVLDMVLMENQLPFFVLECLWELVGMNATLENEALAFFEMYFPCELELQNGVIHHLLHLVHLSLKPDSRKAQTTCASGKISSLRLPQHMGKILRFLCPTHLINTYDRFPTPSQQSLRESEHKSPEQIPPVTELQESPRISKKSQTPSRQSSPQSKHDSPQPWDMIPSATELQEAGVRFQLKQARSFLEVGFEQGLMEMPRLCIYDETDILFRNFIALEQCFPDFGDHFTGYCCFIDNLVNTPRDVSILREADIIGNGLGSDEEVAHLFNKLCKEIVWDFDQSDLADLFQQVNQHTQKRCPRWRAKLVRDYFGNPWAIVSVTAALIILILTFLQTFFSVFAYFKPPKQ